MDPGDPEGALGDLHRPGRGQPELDRGAFLRARRLVARHFRCKPRPTEQSSLHLPRAEAPNPVTPQLLSTERKPLSRLDREVSEGHQGCAVARTACRHASSTGSGLNSFSPWNPRMDHRPFGPLTSSA